MIKKLIGIALLLIIGSMLISAVSDTPSDADIDTNSSVLGSSVSASSLDFGVGTANISVTDTSASIRFSGDKGLLLFWAVEWGDGKTSDITTDDGSSGTLGHSYATTGNYTIKVSLEAYESGGGAFLESVGTKSTTITITKASAEAVLRITSSSVKYVESGASFTHTFTSNVAGTTFSVNLNNASWLSYSSSAKKLTGTAPNISGSDKSYLISVMATSPEGQTASQTFGVFVTAAVIDTYTITFNSNGGTGSISSISSEYGSIVTLPSGGFTKQGYILSGWNTRADGSGTSYNLDRNMKVVSNATLYAVWEPAPVEITLDTDVSISAVNTAFGSINCINNVFSAVAGTIVTLPQLDYKLSDAWIQVNSGWKDAAGNALGFEYIVADEDILTPVFNDYFKLIFTDPVVTVVFDSSASKYFTHRINWGDGQQSVVDNLLSDQLVHRYIANADYTIVVQSTFLSDSVAAQSDVTIANAGGSDVLQYVVSFDTAGGTAIADQTIVDGSTVIEPLQPSKVGYRFTGWYSDEQCTSLYDFNTKIYADTIIYAGWIDRSYAAVTFNSNGGSDIEQLQVEVGSKIIKPADPAKDGFAFAGWYLDEELTVLFDFNTEINQNITLYAKWEESKTVGGSSPLWIVLLLVIIFAVFALSKDVRRW